MSIEAGLYSKLSRIDNVEQYIQTVTTVNLYGNPILAFKSMAIRLASLTFAGLTNHVEPNPLSIKKADLSEYILNFVISFVDTYYDLE